MRKVLTQPQSQQPSQVIKVLLVDDIPETREQLRKLLAFEADIEVVGAASTGREGVALARELRPDIVLMDINMPDMNGIEATEQITREVPTCAIIIMSVQSEADYVRKAMLAGARNFLTKPTSGEELYATIRNVYERTLEARQRYQHVTMMTGTPGTGALPVTTAAHDVARAGKIIVVYSPKGGVGVTTIATNIAAALMREDIKVLLVDAKLQFGDVNVFLNIQSSSNIADLTSTVDDLDDDVVDNVLTVHDSGLRVLLAPPRPEIAETIESAQVGKLVQALAERFDFTVVDMHSLMDDLTINLFDIADRIVLIATPTLPAIKNVRLVLDVLDALDYPPEKTVFVLNRMQSERERGRISAEAIEKNLKRQVAIQIPTDDRAMTAAVNRGAPLVAGERSRSPARELVELALRLDVELLGEEEEMTEVVEQARPSRLRSLFGSGD